MARIRTIKPEFFTSEDIVEMPPLARLLYIAMWCEADKEGRFAWKPKTFKMRYLPGDDCDIDTVCDALLTRGLVVLYGDGLAVIPTFLSHQHINPREKVSGLPAPTPEELTRRARVSDATVTGREEGRKEGKGKEGTGTSPAQAPDAQGDVDQEETVEKRKRRRGTEEDAKAARWMFGLVLAVNATAKPPNWEVWADEVRLMREIDGRTHKEICELFQWAKHDAFWCSNIQSPSKLREKWDQLTERRAQPARTTGQPAKPSAYQVSHLDHSGTVEEMKRGMERRGTVVPVDGEINFDD